MKKPKFKYRSTKRIYYGEPGHETDRWWTVEVSPATQEVNVNGNMLDALKAHPGVTIGCALSRVGLRNSHNFPHPVHYVSVTKSTVLVVDKLNGDGSPKHAMQYGHNYGHITDRNDTGTLKKMVKENPEIIERTFRLHIPRDPRKPIGKTAHDPSSENVGKTNRTKAFVHRGALQRAVKAGLIGNHIAEQITDLSAGG